MSRFLQATAPLAALLTMVLASSASAQIIRRRAPDPPAYYASLSVGYLDAQRIIDGTTNTTWNFGSTAQYRASFERSIGNSSSFGVTATLARLPLAYAGAACQLCEAHVNAWSVGASFSGGAPQGVHPVLQASAGATRFQNFRDDATGARLPPSGDTDFSFAFGSGIGYSTSNRMEFFLVQEWAGIIHQREGLSNGASTLSRQLVTRIGVRYGMGVKK